MVDKSFIKDILQKKLLDEADIGDMEDTNSDSYEERPFRPTPPYSLPMSPTVR